MSYLEWLEASRLNNVFVLSMSHILMLLIGFIGGIIFSIGRAVYKVESSPDDWLIFSSKNHDGLRPRRRKEDK